MLVHQHDEDFEVSAPAKVNLFLEVLGKRSDGYHELETLMVTISLFDTLRFRTVDSAQFVLKNHWCGSPESARLVHELLPNDQRNLVWKAASLLAQAAGVKHAAQIDVFKRIPLAAGLAGGSSDAAATLVGLNRLWKLNLSYSDLRELGALLGSDVPFFLAQTNAAICRGRGELIEPLQMDVPLHLIIVKPDVGLSTAQVFQHCIPAPVASSVSKMAQSLQDGNLTRIGNNLMNRLNWPATRLCPQVQQLETVFTGLPVLGHVMSGSGTSYLGLCRNRQQSVALASRLRALRLGSVFAVRSGV